MEITFVRHAETFGNLDHLWQGHGDSELTERGRRQAVDLGNRLRSAEFDAVVCSDLGRAQETAALAGTAAEPSRVWREVDIGEWEGLTREQVFERFPDQIGALRSGAEVRLGGGESWREFSARVDRAVDSLATLLGESDRALVFTHGGVIQSIVAGHLRLRGRPRPWPVDRLRNTSVTTLRFGRGERSLDVFNDASHTTVEPHPDEVGPVVALMRHAQALANVEGRWQGLADDPLTELGVAQARELAARYDGLSHVYSSALERARVTAGALAERGGIPLTVRPDLHEIAFGDWEDLTPDQIADRFPDEWRRIMVEGADLPRGGTGETMEGAGRRIRRALEQIIAAHPDGGVAVVSHGGAIRAYLCGILGLAFGDRRLLGHPENVSVSHVRMGPSGPSLADYNLVPGR